MVWTGPESVILHISPFLVAVRVCVSGEEETNYELNNTCTSRILIHHPGQTVLRHFRILVTSNSMYVLSI